MKAILLTKYGTSDNLIYTEVAKPMPGPDDVLIKLKYTSINAADLDYVHGHPLIRFTGLTKPAYPILGSDLTGSVEKVGTNVINLRPGDLVWADTSNPLKYGTFAEYTVVPSKSLQKLPDTTTLAEAACLPSAGSVALQNIQLKQPPHKGDTALVNGAGGGIGTMIVQLLTAVGVEVTAVDKQSKHEMLLQIGAARVIDYETTDYLQTKHKYDYVYDLVSARPLNDAVSIVKQHGHFIMLGGTTANILRVLTAAPFLSRRWQKQIHLGVYQTNDHAALVQLAALLEQDIIHPVIDRIIPLEETISGIKALEAGNVLGKIVIKIS